MAEILNVSVNGISMDYFKYGHGSRVYVILPGLSIKSVMEAADAVAEGNKIFRDDFTTYVFDRRKEVPEDYTIHDMARDTVQCIKALGLKDIYLFGASQGGMMAQVVAIENPGLVKKLVLGSTSSHITDEQRGVIDKWIELAKKKDASALYKSFGEEIYPEAVFKQYENYFEDVSKTVTEEELERFIILAKSIIGFNVTEDLKKIDCPVLALGVYEDAVLDSDSTMEIAENLDYRDDFKLYMYVGYGHAAFDTAPDYRKRIYEFFVG